MYDFAVLAHEVPEVQAAQDRKRAEGWRNRRAKVA